MTELRKFNLGRTIQRAGDQGFSCRWETTHKWSKFQLAANRELLESLGFLASVWQSNMEMKSPFS